MSVHLAIASHLRGHKTVLADADPQRSSSEVLRARSAPGPDRVETSGPKLFALQVASQRAGVDNLIIDTPAGPEHELGHAVVLADLTMLVVRPTFLDIAAAVRTIDMARRRGRPAMIVLNQALCPRAGIEPPSVLKALEALRFAGFSVASTVIRSRAAYQTALNSGRSAEELPMSPARQEIAGLWADVEAALYQNAQLRRA